MIVLDHTIVPAHDREASARFFAEIFDVPLATGAHAPVRVNDSLVFDFDDRPDFISMHYAFLVDVLEFEAILNRLRERGVPYGSPPTHNDLQVSARDGVKRFFFHDPNGHSLEVMVRI